MNFGPHLGIEWNRLRESTEQVLTVTLSVISVCVLYLLHFQSTLPAMSDHIPLIVLFYSNTAALVGIAIVLNICCISLTRERRSPSWDSSRENYNFYSLDMLHLRNGSVISSRGSWAECCAWVITTTRCPRLTRGWSWMTSRRVLRVSRQSEVCKTGPAPAWGRIFFRKRKG